MLINVGVVKDEVSDSSYEKKRTNFGKQINSYPLIIDRGVFEKTKKEKEELKKQRSKFKATQRDV